MIVTILIFLLILSVLVLVHEAGHFFVAKFFKIKVEEFGFGIPPRMFGIKRGETVYSINWLPIGGFVKLYGEDEAGAGRISKSDTNSSGKEQKSKIKDPDYDRAFFAKPAWQRALVVVAGVAMNFLLAVVIVSFLFSVVGVPSISDQVKIGEVLNNTPAKSAGLQIGDTIVSMNNIKINSSDQLISVTKSNLGKTIKLEVKDKNNKIKNLEVTPRINYPKNEGPMGIAVSQGYMVKKYPWYQAPFVGTREVLNESGMIAVGLFNIVSQLVTKGSVPSDVAGPVGIAQLTGKFVEVGPYALLSFVSLLSINLAIMNILPIPALDGGRLFFILFEAVTRRKVDPRFEGYAHTIGMIALLALIALITLHDLVRVFSGQPIIPQLK